MKALGRKEDATEKDYSPTKMVHITLMGLDGIDSMGKDVTSQKVQKSSTTAAFKEVLCLLEAQSPFEMVVRSQEVGQSIVRNVVGAIHQIQNEWRE